MVSITAITPISQMNILRHRDIMQFVKVHIASNLLSRYLNPQSLTPAFGLLTTQPFRFPRNSQWVPSTNRIKSKFLKLPLKTIPTLYSSYYKSPWQLNDYFHKSKPWYSASKPWLTQFLPFRMTPLPPKKVPAHIPVFNPFPKLMGSK